MRHVRAILALLGSAMSGAAAAASLSGGPADTRSLAPAHSDIPLIPISFNIDDASPLLRFHGAWEPEWSDTLGREVHTTHGSARASVELAVEGTGVVLYGARDPPSPSGSTISPASGISVRDGAGHLLPSTGGADGELVDVRNASFDRVEVIIDDHTSAAYAVSGATVFTHLDSDTGANDGLPMTRVPFAEDGKANEAFDWGGDWALGSGLGESEGALVSATG